MNYPIDDTPFGEVNKAIIGWNVIVDDDDSCTGWACSREIAEQVRDSLKGLPVAVDGEVRPIPQHGRIGVYQNDALIAMFHSAERAAMFAGKEGQ